MIPNTFCVLREKLRSCISAHISIRLAVPSIYPENPELSERAFWVHYLERMIFDFKAYTNLLIESEVDLRLKDFTGVNALFKKRG